jgi:excisionase family DNA binding protein
MNKRTGIDANRILHKTMRKRSRKDQLPRVDTLLSTAGVARLLNIHANTVRRWSKNGILKGFRLGPRGDRRFKRQDIIGLLKNNIKK